MSAAGTPPCPKKEIKHRSAELTADGRVCEVAMYLWKNDMISDADFDEVRTLRRNSSHHEAGKKLYLDVLYSRSEVTSCRAALDFFDKRTANYSTDVAHYTSNLAAMPLQLRESPTSATSTSPGEASLTLTEESTQTTSRRTDGACDTTNVQKRSAQLRISLGGSGGIETINSEVEVEDSGGESGSSSRNSTTSSIMLALVDQFSNSPMTSRTGSATVRALSGSPATGDGQVVGRTPSDVTSASGSRRSSASYSLAGQHPANAEGAPTQISREDANTAHAPEAQPPPVVMYNGGDNFHEIDSGGNLHPRATHSSATARRGSGQGASPDLSSRNHSPRASTATRDTTADMARATASTNQTYGDTALSLAVPLEDASSGNSTPIVLTPVSTPQRPERSDPTQHPSQIVTGLAPPCLESPAVASLSRQSSVSNESSTERSHHFNTVLSLAKRVYTLAFGRNGYAHDVGIQPYVHGSRLRIAVSPTPQRASHSSTTADADTLSGGESSDGANAERAGNAHAQDDTTDTGPTGGEYPHSRSLDAVDPTKGSSTSQSDDLACLEAILPELLEAVRLARGSAGIADPTEILDAHASDAVAAAATATLSDSCWHGDHAQQQNGEVVSTVGGDVMARQLFPSNGNGPQVGMVGLTQPTDAGNAMPLDLATVSTQDLCRLVHNVEVQLQQRGESTGCQEGDSGAENRFIMHNSSVYPSDDIPLTGGDMLYLNDCMEPRQHHAQDRDFGENDEIVIDMDVKQGGKTIQRNMINKVQPLGNCTALTFRRPDIGPPPSDSTGKVRVELRPRYVQPDMPHLKPARAWVALPAQHGHCCKCTRR